MNKTLKYFLIGAGIGLLVVIPLMFNKKVKNIFNKKLSKDKKMKVLFAGDSFTANNNSYAEQLRSLNANLDIKKITKIGASTNWIYTSMAYDVGRVKYDLVFILAGYNDVYSGVELTDAEKTIYKMIDWVHKNSAKVVIITIPPSGNNANYNKNKQAYTEALNKYIMNSDADYKIDFYSLMENPDKKGYPKDNLVFDGQHANSEGHKLLANEIYKTIFK